MAPGFNSSKTSAFVGGSNLQNSTAAVVVPTMTEAAMAGQLTIGNTVVPGGAPLATCQTTPLLTTGLCQGLPQLLTEACCRAWAR